MSKPFLDKRATDQLNLSVLRRLDPDTEQVLATAGHVALYMFDTAQKAWKRKDVEGSLFLLKRQSQPRFRIVILNKKSQDNFVEDILLDFKFEVATPYVLYRSKLDEVIGIWFYDTTECALLAGLLQRITAAFAGQVPLSDTAPPQVSTSDQPGSAPTPPDDAFWDRQIRDTSSAAADARAKLLQPAHDSAPTPGPHGQPPSDPPSDPTQAGMQSPFGAVSAASSRKTDAGQPEQAQGDFLGKLLGQPSRGNASRSSPPSSTTPPEPSISSPAQTRDTHTGQAQNPLSALFANIKVSNGGAPMAQTPPPNMRPASSNPAAAGYSPALLTPSFFRQHSNPVETAQGNASEPGHSDSNSLQQVFARAASKSTPKSEPPDDALQSQPFPSTTQPASNAGREKIRKALTELAKSDTFLDLIVEQLQSKGVHL